LERRAHTTCGGRSLSDDVIDTLYTLIVNANHGPHVTGGVDPTTVPPVSRVFPYLAPPNPNPPEPASIPSLAEGR